MLRAYDEKYFTPAAISVATVIWQIRAFKADPFTDASTCHFLLALTLLSLLDYFKLVRDCNLYPALHYFIKELYDFLIQ